MEVATLDKRVTWHVEIELWYDLPKYSYNKIRQFTLKI